MLILAIPKNKKKLKQYFVKGPFMQNFSRRSAVLKRMNLREIEKQKLELLTGNEKKFEKVTKKTKYKGSSTNLANNLTETEEQSLKRVVNLGRSGAYRSLFQKIPNPISNSNQSPKNLQREINFNKEDFSIEKFNKKKIEILDLAEVTLLAFLLLIEFCLEIAKKVLIPAL